MYSWEIATERRERDRDLMRTAARERLVSEALAARTDRPTRKSLPLRLGAALASSVAALASILRTATGQSAWLHSN